MKEESELADDLITKLGSLDLNLYGQSKLRNALQLDTSISSFDAVIPFLLLIRIPSVFEASREKTAFLYLKIFVRGMSASILRFIDNVKFKRNLKSHNNKNFSIDGKGLFIFSDFTFYRDVLGPVYRELNLNSVNKFAALQIADDNRVKGFDSYLSLYDSKIQKEKELLDRKLSVIRSKVFSKDFTSSIHDLELKFGIRKHLLVYELKWLFYKEFPRLIVHLAIAENILVNENIRILITADDADSAGRIYSLSASVNKICSLAVQQGFTNENYPDWKHRVVDKIACMGEISRDHMIKQGVAKNDLIITGHPGFDCIRTLDVTKVALISQKYKIDSKKPIVLFASQPYLIGAWTSKKKRIESFRLISKLFSRRLDLTFIVKPHPTDNVRELDSIFSNSKNIISIDARDDIIPCIQLCDIFLTHFSTTSLQALIAGKPVIGVDLADCYDHSNFYKQIDLDAADEFLFPISNDADQLESIINELIEKNYSYDIHRNTLIERFLYRLIFKIDGRASIRVASLIDDLLQINVTKIAS